MPLQLQVCSAHRGLLFCFRRRNLDFLLSTESSGRVSARENSVSAKAKEAQRKKVRAT